MCTHEPRCPSAGDIARGAARVIAGHPEQGRSLLRSGIVLFDYGGLLLPDGSGRRGPAGVRRGSAGLLGALVDKSLVQFGRRLGWRPPPPGRVARHRPRAQRPLRHRLRDFQSRPGRVPRRLVGRGRGLVRGIVRPGQAHGLRSSSSCALLGLAMTGSGADPGWSARLHGAAAQALADLGQTLEPLEGRLADLDRRRRRAAMGAGAFQAEYAAGGTPRPGARSSPGRARNTGGARSITHGCAGERTGRRIR